MNSLTRAVAAGVLSVVLSVDAAPWVYGEIPMVATPLDSALQRTWNGVKARNIRPWADGMVHRPKSETPGDAVSEGQAYGMMLALYMNDQAGFDGIWDGAERNLWNDGNGFYDWRWQDGRVTGSGFATDADQDIALMLIFADALVTKGIWTAHKSPKNVDYKTRAQAILNTLWTKGVNAGALRPGANWGGGGTCGSGAGTWPCGEHVNPGYFSPANYRIFKEFDKSRAWGDVVERSYAIIAKSPGLQNSARSGHPNSAETGQYPGCLKSLQGQG
jgi:endo-1,4-beta-D-glucanase Y